MKKWGREHGADYMLSGEINSITRENRPSPWAHQYRRRRLES